MRGWRRLRAWLSRWTKFLRAVPPPQAEPVLPAAPEIAPVDPVKRPRQAPYRAARLRADILDQLAKYQKYIRRLKKYDPETYATYRRLGAYVAQCDRDEWRAMEVEVSPAFLRMMPGFGAVAIGVGGREHPTGTYDPDARIVAARFAFFTKLKRPAAGVQLMNSGTTYRCRLYWDDDPVMRSFNRDRGFSQDILINVTEDGAVRPLRLLTMEPQTIKHKRGSATTIRHQRWRLPDLDAVAGETPETRCVKIFMLLVNFWVTGAQQSMIRVTATKAGVVMPFLVDALRTPQFFADRVPIPTPGGRRRPIFHVVRPHARGQRDIKLHFAGLREFQWNGYAIRITVPGKDHLAHDEMPVGVMEDSTDAEMASPETMSQEAMAEFLADHIGAPAKDESAA